MSEAIHELSLPTRPRARLARIGPPALVFLSLALVGVAATLETRTSYLQSRLFSALAERATSELAPGPSASVHFPGAGPYDLRHGHALIPAFEARLRAAGWRVEAQTRWSPGLVALHSVGLPGPFREATRPELRIEGRGGELLFEGGTRGYHRFEEVPPVVAATLLFVEDRHLLAPDPPTRNPAVEWDRLVHAALRYPLPGRGPGGSTLATQLEKLRHSPEGVTGSPAEKVRQMLAASLRAYRDGPDTRAVRQTLVLDYLNALPLAGAPGFGEVSGLGEGLRAWFGADPAAVDRTLHELGRGAEPTPEAALAYRRVLALLVATRRPSTLLLHEREALERHVDTHLLLLAQAGVIDRDLAEAAAGLPLGFRSPAASPDHLVARKPAAPVRAPLTRLLGVGSYPVLDDLDLRVESTLDVSAQAAAHALVRSLSDPAALDAVGLRGPRLLTAGADPSRVVWSFALYEKGDDANRVLVQVDSGDTPLDVHTGVRLDLGSVAKLRTVVLYLELVSELHESLAGRTPEELKAVVAEARAARDPLREWVASALAAQPDLDLAGLQEQALERRYSASPYETFSTGGGRQRFGNFDASWNELRPTVRQSFQHSVNLPFIRLMRDLVRHLETRASEGHDPLGRDRADYVLRFADYESQVFLRRFVQRYAGVAPEAMLDAVLERKKALRPTPLAVILRGVAPELSLADFSAEMSQRLGEDAPDEAELATLYERHAPGRFDLNDQGYLAGLHPLELWTAARLRQHPEWAEDWERLADESYGARVHSYRWLYDARKRRAQDRRIAIVREQDAFELVLERWRRLGYPFETITPSYAAAIGSSGDSPAAITELLGIAMNDGLRKPTRRIERLRFAPGSPYETHLAPGPAAPERVMRPETAAAVRGLLVAVVEEGTARRARGAVTGPDGEPLVVGGKTGTGDHRARSFDRWGNVVDERVVSRSAAFGFLVGERHYGVVTAHVAGPEAGDYEFTSALTAQLFRALAPAIAGAVAGDAAEPASEDLPAPEVVAEVAARG